MHRLPLLMVAWLAVAVLIAGTLAIPALASEAPGKLPLGVYNAPMQLAPGGGQQFQCGTYAGNENANVWMAHVNQAQKMQRASSAPPSFIEYDDVWVVEDDGSMAFTGVNAGDLNLLTFRFTPDGFGGYDVTSIPFAFDPVFGTDLGLADDGNANVAVLFSFPFYGTNWTDAYVNANGGIAFGAIVNPSGFFTNDEFFSDTPKIVPYFLDLNPDASGAVYHKAEATRSTFTWSAVWEYGTTTPNTIQLVIHDDGRIDMSFPGTNTTIQSNGSPITTGIHPGGTPSLDLIDFTADVPHSGGNLTGIYELFYSYTNPLVNEVGLFQFFYQNYADVFFQLNFFTTFTQTMGGFANEQNISNDVTGIHLGIFDNSGLYGSNGVLESRCNMNRMNAWPIDPTNRFFGSQNNFLTIMGQEAGHRWGAFMWFDNGGGPSNLILGRSDAHWSYYVDVDHSSLEGGNWEFVSGSNYTTPTMIDFFGDIDEYTFGLRTPEEVTETFYVSSPSNNTSSARSAGTPIQGAGATGTAVTVTIDDIIANEGPRTPTFDNENKDLRQAFILLHPQGVPPTQQQLDQIAGFRRAWEDYFELSCDGRITCNTRLSLELPVAVLEGNVIDELYFTPIPDLTATLVERGFIQFVVAGGRYHFRCMPDTTTPPEPTECCVTVMLEAPGYETKLVNFCLPYGQTTDGDVRLRPIPVGIEDGVTPLAGAELRQNYPNPFNPETTIEYSIGKSADVRLELYNVHGQLVRTLVDARKSAGVHQAFWNGRDLNGQLAGSGVYFARLTTAEGTMNRKIVMLK